MTDQAILARHLSKRFWLRSEHRTALKERIIRGKAPQGRELWALRDASFEVGRGSTFGLVGPNGSGKSTALKVLAGIYRPTSGTVVVNGRVSALLELGAGFHGELTGRENIRLNATILGMSARQIDAAMDGIIDFSGIEPFIDSPVKVYSSGMVVRLGFAIAVALDPEILIIDEVIAVGDEEFQRKCFDHLFELRKRGVTIVLCTHALGLIQDLCDQAIWLDLGRVRALGAARQIVDSYLGDVNERETLNQATPVDAKSGAAPSKRLGTGEVHVTDVSFMDGDGRPGPMLLSESPCTVRLHFVAHEAVPRAVFGIGFVHESGVNVAGPNSGRTGPWPLAKGEGYVDFVVDELLLSPATYLLSTAIVDRGHTYDYADREFELHVRGQGDQEPGLVRMRGTWRTPVMTPSWTTGELAAIGRSSRAGR
jgi:lipopolysaccharide transport system ATP-binding protein